MAKVSWIHRQVLDFKMSGTLLDFLGDWIAMGRHLRALGVNMDESYFTYSPPSLDWLFALVVDDR